MSTTNDRALTWMIVLCGILFTSISLWLGQDKPPSQETFLLILMFVSPFVILGWSSNLGNKLNAVGLSLGNRLLLGLLTLYIFSHIWGHLDYGNSYEQSEWILAFLIAIISFIGSMVFFIYSLVKHLAKS